MMKGKDELGKDLGHFDHVSERVHDPARSRDEKPCLNQPFIFGINHEVVKISSRTILHHDMGFS